jgi:hypothetical protein
MRSMQYQLGNLGTISAFALKTQGNQARKPVSRWPVAGPSYEVTFGKETDSQAFARSQTSAAKKIRTAFFWAITQLTVVILDP